MVPPQLGHLKPKLTVDCLKDTITNIYLLTVEIGRVSGGFVVMAQQPIEHIVLYSFREHEALRTAVQYIKNLATTAKRNGEPYIRSIKCGTTRPAENVRSLGKSRLALGVKCRFCACQGCGSIAR